MIDIKGLSEYKSDQASRICLGVFDGFHKGHQALMNESEYMVTFQPHPKLILLDTPIELQQPQWNKPITQKRLLFHLVKK